MTSDMAWAASAACAQISPDTLFVRGAAQRTARKVCFTCPVRMACLAEALETRMEFGVWGGLTERERRAVLVYHPDVTDWASWLAEHDEELPPHGVVRRPIAGVRASA